ncbi:MAG: hypothetical protein J6T19_00915 [Paludibacteraceae bacterium]|nr:hypothetical protein [Paludibacteraceae bacterium]
MTKKTYDTPTLQLIALRARDIITDSYDPEYLDPNKPNNILDDQVVYIAW